MKELSEKQIILKIQQGEINYFTFLVKKYSGLAYNYASSKVNHREDAQDIVQNSFIKIYKAIDRLDSNRPFYPYFFTILKNEIKQFFRRNRQHLPLNEEVLVQESTPQISDLDFFIKRLTTRYQQVLKLYIEGFSYREISFKVGKPINSIRTLIRRAKIQIRNAQRSKEAE
jgi:RNA polymerase sigma-70 factor (ECF subfamily)